jgi:uncharacterized protein (DUF697 family)
LAARSEYGTASGAVVPRTKLPVGPVAIWGLLKELRVAAEDVKPLAVTGPPSLAGALRKDLARGGDAKLIRETPVEGSAVVVHVVAGPHSADDERVLRAAHTAKVPIVVLLADPDLDDRAVPYVLATDVLRVERGRGFPLDAIARRVAHKLGERGTALAAQLPIVRRAVCAELIESFARKNGIVGAAVFIPGVDMPVLTLNQLRLVLRIGAAYGEELDTQRLPEILGVIGGGFGFRMVARELLDLVPVAGWVVKGAVAYVGTRAIGEAAVRYFEARASAAR